MYVPVLVGESCIFSFLLRFRVTEPDTGYSFCGHYLGVLMPQILHWFVARFVIVNTDIERQKQKQTK